jgi:hypothetical protein
MDVKRDALGSEGTGLGWGFGYGYNIAAFQLESGIRQPGVDTYPALFDKLLDIGAGVFGEAQGDETVKPPDATFSNDLSGALHRQAPSAQNGI